MQRERATDLADLPHQFEPGVEASRCDLCQLGATEIRHVAWEKASANTPPAPFPRERDA